MNSLREQWNNFDSLGFLGGQTSHFYKGISVIIRITIYQLIACGVFHMGPWGTVDSTLGVRESTRTFSVSWTAQGPNSPNKTMAKLTRLQRLTLNNVYPEAQNSTNTPFLPKKIKSTPTAFHTPRLLAALYRVDRWLIHQRPVKNGAENQLVKRPKEKCVAYGSISSGAKCWTYPSSSTWNLPQVYGKITFIGSTWWSLGTSGHVGIWGIWKHQVTLDQGTEKRWRLCWTRKTEMLIDFHDWDILALMLDTFSSHVLQIATWDLWFFRSQTSCECVI